MNLVDQHPCRDQPRIGIGLDDGPVVPVGLLQLQHFPVLLERLQHLTEVELGPFRRDRLQVAGVGPEIVAARLGLGRDEVEVAEGKTALGLGMVDAGEPEILPPGRVRRSTDQQAHRGGRAEFVDRPAVDDEVLVPVHHHPVGGRRGMAHHPTRDRDRLVGPDGPDVGVLGDRRIADRGRVHEGEMRLVEQVVDHETVIGGDVEIGALVAPVRAYPPREGDDQVLVGLRGVAEPDPDPVVFLDRRKDAHPRIRRYRRLARHAYAGPRPVEFEPVIVAAQPVAFGHALAERHPAVAAAVLEGDRLPRPGAPEDDRLVTDRPRERGAIDLLGLGRDVPAILQEHGTLLPEMPPGRRRDQCSVISRPKPGFRSSMPFCRKAYQ